MDFIKDLVKLIDIPNLYQFFALSLHIGPYRQSKLDLSKYSKFLVKKTI